MCFGEDKRDAGLGPGQDGSQSWYSVTHTLALPRVVISLFLT